MIFKNAKFCWHIDCGLAYKLCTNYDYNTEFSRNLYGLRLEFVSQIDLTKTDWTRHICLQNV